MAHYDNCSFCGARLAYKSQINQRFCSDECKVDFFNEERKLARAKKRIDDTIDTLIFALTNEGEIGLQARDILRDVASRAHNAGRDAKWKCTHCGQTRWGRPDRGDHCPFCKNRTWSLVLETMPNDDKNRYSPKVT